TNAFYWDRNEESRAWAQRYFQRMNKMPNMTQAGIYSATAHYLKAVEAAGTDATQPVIGEDALNPDQRLLRQEWKDPRGRPDGARDVLVRGQEACGIQGGMGLLQACCHDPGGRGIPAVVGIQMSAGEEGAVSVYFWCGRITQPLHHCRHARSYPSATAGRTGGTCDFRRALRRTRHGTLWADTEARTIRPDGR